MEHISNYRDILQQFGPDYVVLNKNFEWIKGFTTLLSNANLENITALCTYFNQYTQSSETERRLKQRENLQKEIEQSVQEIATLESSMFNSETETLMNSTKHTIVSTVQQINSNPLQTLMAATLPTLAELQQQLQHIEV